MLAFNANGKLKEKKIARLKCISIILGRAMYRTSSNFFIDKTVKMKNDLNCERVYTFIAYWRFIVVSLSDLLHDLNFKFLHF